MHLIIKGSQAEADIAATCRGIELHTVRELCGAGWCVADVYDEDKQRAVRWHAERARSPFPAGTLLHYSGEADE